jgi:hypothetical protein
MIRLYIGKSFTGVTVRKDANWPGMWRVHSADGQVSDMANLTRAKDAAIYWARPRGLGGTEKVRWDVRETRITAPYMRSAASADSQHQPRALARPRAFYSKAI